MGKYAPGNNLLANWAPSNSPNEFSPTSVGSNIFYCFSAKLSRWKQQQQQQQQKNKNGGPVFSPHAAINNFH